MDEEEEEPFCSGVSVRVTLPEGQRICIVWASLYIDPSSAYAQYAVEVWAGAGRETHTIGTLSLEKPDVAVPQVVLSDEFDLCHDSPDGTVLLYFHVLGPPPPDTEQEEAVLANEVEEDGDSAADAPAWDGEPTVEAGVEYEPLDEDDYAELNDSDNESDEFANLYYCFLGPPPPEREEEEAVLADDEDEYEPLDEDDDSAECNGSDSDNSKDDIRHLEFLGPARFAAVENTAGFMQIATNASGGQEGKEIFVQYRYTRFSWTWSGRGAVEPCTTTKLLPLSFLAPSACDLATSLTWVGSSLGPLIYPGLFRRQLQELWSTLVAPAINTISPQASHVNVTVDVGILRREDHTPERMEHMRGALEVKMQEAWPQCFYTHKVLHLPEPVRPAKRRRVTEDEEEDDECSVCYEPLESSVVAWPGCRHVFHGVCVEKTLERSEMCPLCRRRLSTKPNASTLSVE